VNPRANQAVKDALLVGIGWVKVAYEYHSEKKNLPRTDEDVSADIEALIAEAMNMTGRTRVYVGMEVEADTPAPAAPKVRAPRKSSAPAETAPESSFVADQAALEQAPTP